jgi:hypothetical protein
MNNKINQINRLQQQIAQRSNYLDARERNIRSREQMLGRNPGGGGRSGPNQMGVDPSQMQSNPNLCNLIPGNVGSINNVIWPFFFSTDFITLVPNTAIKTGFSVTQEAAFVMMSYTKQVYTFDGVNTYTYIDPDQPGATGIAPNLSFTIRDSQSGRDFENFPIDLDTVGNPGYPTIFPRPSMFLPNSNVEISFQNSDPAANYVAFLTVFGYRCRIQDAENILSLVFA